MPVTTEISKVRYSGNDTTRVFSFNYPVLDESHLQVIISQEDDDGNSINEETLTLDTDYSVSGVPGSSVEVTYPKEAEDDLLPDGWFITLNRVLPLKQETDFETQGGFFASVHTAVADYLMQCIQQLQEQIDRCFKLSVSQSEAGEDVLDELNDAVDAAQSAQVSAETAQGLAETARDEAVAAVGSISIASQAEAEAGTDNEKHMTSLRTAQSIAARIDTDETMAANSDAVVPSQQAAKAYTDGRVAVGAPNESSYAFNQSYLAATTLSVTAWMSDTSVVRSLQGVVGLTSSPNIGVAYQEVPAVAHNTPFIHFTVPKGYYWMVNIQGEGAIGTVVAVPVGN